MGSDRIQLEATWKQALEDEFAQRYMHDLRAFLTQRKQSAQVYPPGMQIFAALDSTPLPQVKVVIIGQDPYHGPGQAHGLSFSVPDGVKPPPSLMNIFTEISSDLGGGERDLGSARCGNLRAWAQQGVLLLNAVLTVEAGQAGSHRDKGWERFTDAVVSAVNAQNHGCVFLLWGSYAQKKGGVVDKQRHLVLQAPHPSPLSAHRGFFGCKHFSQANEYLAAQGKAPIDWFALGN